MAFLPSFGNPLVPWFGSVNQVLKYFCVSSMICSEKCLWIAYFHHCVGILSCPGQWRKIKKQYIAIIFNFFSNLKKV